MNIVPRRLLAFAMVGLFASLPLAHADEKGDMAAGLALIKSNGCMACHNLKGTKVGPSFRSIAAQFADQPVDVATQTIEIDIHDGRSTMMLPHPSISRADLDKIAHWVLSQKGD